MTGSSIGLNPSGCDYGDAELGRNAEATALSLVEPHTGPLCRVDQQVIFRGAPNEPVAILATRPDEQRRQTRPHFGLPDCPSDFAYHSNNSSTGVTTSS